MSVVSGITQAVMGSEATEDAAEIQASASNYAADLADKQWKTTNEQLAPWREAGTAAINRLGAGVKSGGEFDQFTYNDMTADPGYAWRLQQGIDSLMASGTAAGNYGSGNLGAALQSYGQNMASNEYANAYSRWNDQFNRLAQIAGVGQSAVNTTGTFGADAANTIGSQYVNAANAQAAGTINSANAIIGGIGNTSNQAMSGLGTYLKYQQQQSALEQMQAARNSSYWGGGLGDDAAIENIINSYDWLEAL